MREVCDKIKIHPELHDARRPTLWSLSLSLALRFCGALLQLCASRWRKSVWNSYQQNCVYSPVIQTRHAESFLSRLYICTSMEPDARVRRAIAFPLRDAVSDWNEDARMPKRLNSKRGISRYIGRIIPFLRLAHFPLWCLSAKPIKRPKWQFDTQIIRNSWRRRRRRRHCVDMNLSTKVTECTCGESYLWVCVQLFPWKSSGAMAHKETSARYC